MSTRKPLIFGLLSSTTLGAFATLGLVACSSDETLADRPGFIDSEAGTDAVANLPDASPPDDGGVGKDGGPQRDPFDPKDEPVTCAATGPCAKQLVAGANHFCALMSDGTVRCWGDDEYGALGGGFPPKVPKGPSPNGGADAATTLVAELTDVTQISAGQRTTCARRGDGSVYCWGENSQGQLGLDDVRAQWDYDRHPLASPVAIRDSAVRVDVGPQVACAMLSTGKVACWGNNDHLQLARSKAEPMPALGPDFAELDPFALSRISIGSATTFGITTAGDLVNWGDIAGRDGLLGARMTSISPDPAPNAIPNLSNVTSMAAAVTKYGGGGGGWPPKPPTRLSHACALADGEVYCWGRSSVGALCTGLTDEELLPTPAPIKGKAWPQQLAVGDDVTCARMTDGSIQCCGGADKGRLGTGQTEPFSTFFTPIASFKSHAVQVATSDFAVCALVKDGTVECWGSNEYGELATGERDDDPHPTPVKIAF